MVTQAEGEILCKTCVCSSDKAIREPDCHPAALETMLEDCYDWMKCEDLLRGKEKGLPLSPGGGLPSKADSRFKPAFRYQALRRRRAAPMPSRPTPMSAIVVGSGTLTWTG